MIRATTESIVLQVNKFIEIAKETYRIEKGEMLILSIRSGLYHFDKDHTDETLKVFIESNMMFLKVRLAGSESVNVKISLKTKLSSISTLICCAFCEFPHCCGKAIGHTIHFLDGYYLEGKSDKDKIKLFDSYLDLCKEILTVSPYTSVDFISSVENGHLINKVFPNVKRFKLIHRFTNQRMTNKNVCSQYEFNLDY